MGRAEGEKCFQYYFKAIKRIGKNLSVLAD